ncbi:KH domain-containing protein [Candidatus Saccharibacteria bacterium]|nr:KH domain-containing protein [Candidatus Saccharibacteria bacterium]MBI3337913.1 KH domain-containing protein [Candidatus Saccharibacteria bacterium]
MEESIQYAKKYLEDLLSFFGLNTDVYATTEDNEVIELNVPSTHLNGFLIGQRGETVRALQFMVSNALRSNEFEFTRVNIDVADYKKQRASRLEDRAMEWVNAVKKSGKPMNLPPMNAADRRVVHKLASGQGLETESVGEGRDRHIVLKPGGEGHSANEDSSTKDKPVDEVTNTSENNTFETNIPEANIPGATTPEIKSSEANTSENNPEE